ncbi:GTP pyrophosphokinase family protein [Sedimentibacter sp. zth1]|uniref:GTP pyrophosphokinase n=1 Tax=Sedimentibacter sp. zth1 TaxID=2816908 RepID=UPI001A91112F|nr:GTP pyrophosphokinase family protein [Sedimentibacter sp. zth1]QSX07215.1 GTP pyrophosphokinase family protein [Sedimentibacter sp. zth1]
MENELQKVFVKNTIVPQDVEEVFEHAMKFQELMMMYNCAIKEVKTKLEVLNDELSIRNKRNPIDFIKSRVKKPMSIADKLERYGFDINLKSILDNLNDVAGIRVVCPFIDDIYDIAHMLSIQDDIKIIQIKDYIKNPKPNGYRSYHMIVEIPVFFSDRKLPMKVEIQIRTIAMDFWASLEHELKYKKNVQESEEIVDELKECAKIINQTDAKMMEIRNRIKEE